MPQIIKSSFSAPNEMKSDELKEYGGLEVSKGSVKSNLKKSAGAKRLKGKRNSGTNKPSPDAGGLVEW